MLNGFIHFHGYSGGPTFSKGGGGGGGGGGGSNFIHEPGGGGGGGGPIAYSLYKPI